MSPTLERSLDATEWVPPRDATHRHSAWPLIWCVPVGVTGAIAWALGGPVAGAIAAGATAAGVELWVRSQGMLALRSVRAVRLEGPGAARLHNLVQGLSRGRVPSLWLIPQGGPNAMICRTHGPVLAVTQSLLDDYTRTELEAVVAHGVVRLSEVNKLSRAVALSSGGRKMTPRVGSAQDAAAVAMTLYPPALARAIEKARPQAGRFAAFWFAGDERTHEPQSMRERWLLDL